MILFALHTIPSSSNTSRFQFLFTDVLCGRGGGSNNHPGNEAFRELVNEVKLPYVNCPKREKVRIIICFACHYLYLNLCNF
jgi:hypothetical protein